MHQIVQDLSESSLVPAIESNLCDFIPLFSALPRAEVFDTPELLGSITPIPYPTFNSIVRARLHPDTADRAIASAVNRGRERGVPMLWWAGPSSRPFDLGARLEEHGFLPAETPPGMAADLHALPDWTGGSPGLRIEEVGNEEMLRMWCRTLAEGFEMPDFAEAAFLDLFHGQGFGPGLPCRNYLALLDGAPVATASLFLSSGVAGIYNVTTVPNARRRGFGAAITLKPLLDARAAGYRVGILHASTEGAPVYRRLGFREYCTFRLFLWADPPTS